MIDRRRVMGGGDEDAWKGGYIKAAETVYGKSQLLLLPFSTTAKTTTAYREDIAGAFIYNKALKYGVIVYANTYYGYAKTLYQVTNCYLSSAELSRIKTNIPRHGRNDTSVFYDGLAIYNTIFQSGSETRSGISSLDTDFTYEGTSFTATAYIPTLSEVLRYIYSYEYETFKPELTASDTEDYAQRYQSAYWYWRKLQKYLRGDDHTNNKYAIVLTGAIDRNDLILHWSGGTAQVIDDLNTEEDNHWTIFLRIPENIVEQLP